MSNVDPEFRPSIDIENECFSFLTDSERSALDAEISEHGYLSIENVRLLVGQNAPKDSGDVSTIDGELLLHIDTRTNYRIFIIGGDVHTRESLMCAYPFKELNTTPEQVLSRQEVLIINDGIDFATRIVGDTRPVMAVKDLVKSAVCRGVEPVEARFKAVKTKVYLAGEGWDDFITMQRFVRSFSRFITPLQLENGQSPGESFGATVRALATLALGGTKQIENGEAQRPS